jgi:hypothetical protein
MTRDRPNRRIGFVGLVETTAVMALLVVSGCAAKVENYNCPTVDATGDPGNILGGSTWALDDNTCMATYDRVQSGDWCSQLVYDASGVRFVMLGHGMVAPQKDMRDSTGELTSTSEIKFAADSTYTSTLTFQGPGETYFPSSCLRAYGSAPSCDDLVAGLGANLADNGAAIQSYRLTPLGLLPSFPPEVTPQPSYFLFDCQGEGGVKPTSNGCHCTYTVRLVVPDKGTWAVHDQNRLTLFSITEAIPFENDFSAVGSALAMTGHGGLDLMGQPGLRTLVFKKQ